MTSKPQSKKAVWFLLTPTRRLTVAIVFGLAGLLLVAIQYRFQLMITCDTASYAQRLILILKGRLLDISNVQPLGWSFLSIPLFELGIPPLYCFIFLASLSYVLLLWCALEILYPYCSPMTTLIACSVIALEPYFSSLIWSGLTDVPFTAVIATLTVICIRTNISAWNSILLGVIAAIACHLRYSGLFLFLGVPILQLVRGASLKNGIIHGGIALGSLGIFASPLFVRNLLAGQDILWKDPIQSGGSLFESAVLWVTHHLRAALLIPTSCIFEIQANMKWWYIIITIGILFLLIVIAFTLNYRRNKLLLITFLMAGMYTAAMLWATRFHIETRYPMPGIYLMLLWGFVAIEIVGKKYQTMRKLLISLVLMHAVAVCVYMAIVGYNFKGCPEFEESIKELRDHQLSGDKIAVVDHRGWPLFALVSDITPIFVDSDESISSLKEIRSVGQAIILAPKVRGEKGNRKFILTPWSITLEDWVKQYPDEFRLRYRGEWIMIVEHLGRRN